MKAREAGLKWGARLKRVKVLVAQRRAQYLEELLTQLRLIPHLMGSCRERNF